MALLRDVLLLSRRPPPCDVLHLVTSSSLRCPPPCDVLLLATSQRPPPCNFAMSSSSQCLLATSRCLLHATSSSTRRPPPHDVLLHATLRCPPPRDFMMSSSLQLRDVLLQTTSRRPLLLCCSRAAKQNFFQLNCHFWAAAHRPMFSPSPLLPAFIKTEQGGKNNGEKISCLDNFAVHSLTFFSIKV
jgi:hypothetical protein